MPSSTSAIERAGLASEEARHWTSERDSAVVEARAGGASLAQVAAATRLSRSAVAKIEKRSTMARG